MRVVIQRVTRASVTIKNTIKASINNGLMILLSIERDDEIKDIEWLCTKIVCLRIFNDAEGAMNKSIQEVDGDILLISQFTLHASTQKGNRPSFIRSAKPDLAKPLYEQFHSTLEKLLKKPVGTGEFGAEMAVELINDGPVTIIIDSKIKE